MLQFRIKSFDVWKAKYDYVMSLSLTAYVSALLDVIFTLLCPGQYVIRTPVCHSPLMFTVFLGTEGN